MLYIYSIRPTHRFLVVIKLCLIQVWSNLVCSSIDRIATPCLHCISPSSHTDVPFLEPLCALML
uniref:Uncharacterized protein n=1 Tax=Arundo donax TaxID=35708 RepID=A0A0A9CR51_ARUDO